MSAAFSEAVHVRIVDQGYIGEKPTTAARRHGIEPEVVTLPEAQHGFVSSPTHWSVEDSFVWAPRFRRLVKECGRSASTLADLNVPAFVGLMLKRPGSIATGS